MADDNARIVSKRAGGARKGVDGKLPLDKAYAYMPVRGHETEPESTATFDPLDAVPSLPWGYSKGLHGKGITAGPRDEKAEVHKSWGDPEDDDDWYN